MVPAYLFLVSLALFIAICFIWRLSSRRASLPCPVWLGWLVELDNPFARATRAAVIVEYLCIQPGMIVLDAGCGPGRVTIPLAKKVSEIGIGEVVAMDIQAGMLARVREKAQTENLTNIRYLQAGLGEGKLAPAQFDLALLVFVLGEIPDQAAALKEIFSALKPGGILSVSETMFDNHYQSRASVVRLLNEVGFRQGAFYGNRVAFTLHAEKP